jgi:DNA-binding CsgD family transcriptional regulator
MAKKFTIEEIRKIKDLPIEQIADILDVSTQTVYKKLKAFGFGKRVGKEPLSKKIISEIINLAGRGLKPQAIAEKLGITTVSVRKYLKENGIKISMTNFREALSESKVEKIKKLHNEGYSAREIAEKLDITTGTVYKYTKLIQTGRVYNASKLQSLIEKAGFNLSKAGESLGITRANMSLLVKRYGIEDFVKEGKRHLRKNSMNEIISLLKQGKTIEQVADKTGKSLFQVAKAAEALRKGKI